METKKYFYRKDIGNGLVVQSMQPEDAGQLEALQRIVFPTLADDELIRAEHYLRHLELFPEGQLVIKDGDKVVAMTTTMRSKFDFDHYHHTFKETIAGGWLTNHDPEGDWLYGLDIGVHPDYRGRGLARILYRARHEIARQLGLKGQITVGMMNGYGAVSDQMSGEQFYQELLAGKRTDPTVSAQMKIGFEPIALIPDYLNDPACGNYGVLIKIDIDKTI
ncbi:GNAT family N-acetyltransferase [Flavihumibacter profundi]|jgi:GNAT superfamily N-acetyltransferase|uniref:GNAT family N-acetyltransferase n=1 Tax=Flavihumibacter profundi TaxID=2716883 RepID=UPI001CC44982|nr:GNAT family N-acetyltransferase [Flavihumibacter profundi]MBZ5858819.1 GNAT family N-acetyltransferase [Flavihumibacter profundi]